MAPKPLLARALAAVVALAAGCAPRDAHRFTDVVETRPSPDGAVVAALVWDEHGVGRPHLSGIVVVARGGEPRDAVPVVLAAEDFRPLGFRWTAHDALEVRLPCGAWSSLANRVVVGARVVMVAFTPPQFCLGAASALPAGASGPAAIVVSPN